MYLNLLGMREDAGAGTLSPISTGLLVVLCGSGLIRTSGCYDSVTKKVPETSNIRN